LEARRWNAVAGTGDLQKIRTEIDRGRPVIVLIQVREGRYHYVVVVAAGADEIVLHDPARAPSRRIPAATFHAAWREAGRWLVVLLPPAQKAVEPAREASTPVPGAATQTPIDSRESACPGVADGVALAEAGDRPGARRALEKATASCPGDSAPWR